MYTYEIDHRNYRYYDSNSDYIIDKENLYDEGNSNSGFEDHESPSGVWGGSLPERRIRRSTAKHMKKSFDKAKASISEERRWRVSTHTVKELKSMKCYASNGGSVYALDGTDIVSVCKKEGDSVRGKDLIKDAVRRGGNKLDSYEGNHNFYVKCGFTPVSWCKFDEAYAPSDWKKGEYPPEDIIFYKYTGNTETYKNLREFKNSVPCANDYMEAYKRRDESQWE